MLKRFSMVFMTMVLAIIALLLGAKNSTGPNTVSFDEPIALWLSIGVLVALFLPPFIMSLFNHLAVKVISAIYQGLIVLSFSTLILVGVFIPSFWIMIIGALGTIVSICSIFVTIMAGFKRETCI